MIHALTLTDILLMLVLGAVVGVGLMVRRTARQFKKLIDHPDSKHQRMLRTLSEGQRALSIQQAFSSLGFKYPVFFHGWCIDPFLAESILRTLQQRRPRVIVELGSGMSTVFIATLLDRLGLHDTRHIAIDHLEEFLDHTRQNLELQGLGGKTELWFCPLSAQQADEPQWYQGVPERLEGTQLDLVLVDGPPGRLHAHARRPAMYALRSLLSEQAVLYLDDANRPHERATIDAWKNAYPELALRIERRGHGFAEFDARRKAEPS